MESEQGLGWEGQSTLEFDSPACTRYVNESSVSIQEAYAASASFAFLQPYNELLHVSEGGELERCHNAHEAQCHYPKRPSVFKRITLIYCTSSDSVDVERNLNVAI